MKHAIEGLRGMPAKGGNPDLDNIEVARAVVHMANAGGAKLKNLKSKQLLQMLLRNKHYEALLFRKQKASRRLAFYF